MSDVGTSVLLAFICVGGLGVSDLDFEKECERGTLYSERGDFDKSLEILEPLLGRLSEEKSPEYYLKCLNELLKIHVERKDLKKIKKTYLKLREFGHKEGSPFSSYTYYTLGLCGAYMGSHDEAFECFQKSLALGLHSGSKKDMCYSLAGRAISFSRLGNYSESLEELKKLEIFLEVLHMPDLNIISKILMSVALRKLERFDEAIEKLWACLESLQREKNFYYYLHVLYSIGVAHLEKGDKDSARIYLQLLKKSIDPKNFVRLLEDTDAKLSQIGCLESHGFDLVYDTKKKLVIEREKGALDFKQQIILQDLLALFMKHQGSSFSKKELVRKVWDEDYSPLAHDNKIYVTIKRLRKLIEPDMSKPKYIFRAKTGYYLTKSVKTKIEGHI